MAPAEPGSLWWQILGETLWGKRGLIKANHLWLPLGVILSTNAFEQQRPLWLECLRILVVIACWSQASILVNDIADRQEDGPLGKLRWICRLPTGLGAWVVALVAVFGALLIAQARATGWAFAAYAAATLLALLYSIRPVRIKERGVAGLLNYSLAGTLAFVVLPWAWFGSDWVTLTVLAPAVFLDKWVNLHFHQVIDYEADSRSGVRTYSVAVGPQCARRALGWAAGLGSVWLLGTLAFVTLSLPTWRVAVGGTATAVVLAVAVYARSVRRHPERASALLQELPWTYLGLTLTLFRVLPLVLFVRLALAEPTMWAVFGVVASLSLVESWHSFQYHYD